MPYVVAKYNALLEQGATFAAMRLRWFETTWDASTVGERCERWMNFCQCGTFSIKEEN